MALDSSPEDLTLLLVDFKGGAAFGPCADLPHVVGLVTDLDEHLVRRVLTSLEAELRRREGVLARAGCADLDEHRHRLDPADRMPRLVVVVDELRALVDEHPDAVSALVRLAAQGRSLGIHLVLATQRPAGTVTAEVQANVNLRVAFRVRDRADSVHVVEDDSAASLPADVPGRGVARGGDGTSTTFQAALVAPPVPSGPSLVVLPAGTEPGPGTGTGPGTGAGPGTATADRAAELAAVVEVVRSAHDATGAAPPRRPWVPPLPTTLPSGDAPPGTLALVDEPDRQRHVPWTWDPTVPLWRVVGRPRSGRTTALRALVAAAASLLPPERLHVHVLGPDLEPWPFPHVGTVARLGDAAAVHALLDHLSAPPGPGVPLRLLLVDGWDQLTDADDARSFAPASERLLRLARDGARTGVVCAVSGGRDLLRPRWSGLGGEVVLLGTSDPLDLALLGIGSGGLTGPVGPGRGLRALDGREVQVLDPSSAAVPPRRALAAGAPAPWTFQPLPTRVGRHEVEALPGGGWPLGVTAPGGDCWAWRPAEHGRRLLVAGPPRSGRSTALRTLAAAAVADGRRVVLVRPGGGPREPRRIEVPTEPETPPFGVPGLEVLGPDEVDRLVALRTDHPDLVVLVDDANRLDDTACRPVLDEIADLVDRDGGAIAVATSATGLGTRFRGLDVSVARHRTGLLLRPGPDDPAALGLPRAAAVSSGAHDPPGRGLLVVDREVVALQVLLDTRTDAPRGAPVAPDEPEGRWTQRSLGVVELHVGNPRDERGTQGQQGEDDHEPAEPRPVGLEQADADRHEEQVPHDGRRARPAPLAEPAAGQERQTHTPEGDDHGRHDDPAGVAALPHDQLVHVEHGEAEERERLEPAEHRCEAARAGRRGAVERRERRHHRSLGERYDHASRRPTPPSGTRDPCPPVEPDVTTDTRNGWGYPLAAIG
ncbi:FtsK/SpoIIIE domain-containing protein [Phycicoccus sp. HDW14]|uniref:FtsK/SpoIIIE domain-containing protein n=1 Tax=Phycicoccus sp. HDW14 TaxID=2714941 RepID=UPI001F10ECEA|nr:FtsK/SpoIIIE domain-containing protein [Phycicoccus sp. HDW14]